MTLGLSFPRKRESRGSSVQRCWVPASAGTTVVRCASLLALCAALIVPAYAADVVPTEQDRATQARAIAIAEQLRCLVCQNQTIADSNADLAVDLRRQVREQIAAGRTDREVLDFMTERYGDFVLYRPPFKATTALLWGGPGLLLVIGAIMLARLVRERRVAEPPPLTPDERARANRLLTGDPGNDA
jgi:cytochrome c-type biogenesis protein CcmH